MAGYQPGNPVSDLNPKPMRGSAPSVVADVVPSDATTFAKPPLSLYIGTGGDVRVEAWEGGIVTYKNLPDASSIYLRVKRVLATGTTASNIIAES